MSESPLLVYGVSAPHMRGGIALLDGRVKFFTEETRFMGGWTLWQVLKYCDHRGWILEQIFKKKEERDGADAERDTVHNGVRERQHDSGSVRDVGRVPADPPEEVV